MHQSTHKFSTQSLLCPKFFLPTGQTRDRTRDQPAASSERINRVLQSLREGIREALSRTGTNCVRSRFDTSDIIQESLLQIWKQLQAGDMAELEMTRGLLYVIAKGHANKLRRFHLSKKRDVSRETKSAVVSTESISDPLTLAEIREQLGRLCEVLTLIHPARQFVVFRRVFDDATYREIAGELNRSKDWVRRQYSKAMREIRTLMTEF